MHALFPKIKGILYTLIVLSILEVLFNFLGFNKIGTKMLASTVPILNILLFIFLIVILRNVIRKSASKDQQYQQLLDLSPEAIYVHRKGTVIYSNEAGVKLFGVKDGLSLINRPWKDILDTKSYESLIASSKKFETDQQFKIHHFQLYREDGSVRYIEAKSTHINFDGKPAREVIARDITVQEKNQKMLKEFSYLDPLTQLPNRRSLLDNLDQIIEQAKHTHSRFSMMFIDLDGFKPINDTYGHDMGDRLLKHVSDFLKLCIGDEDVVGRFGGDEFIVILPDATQTDGPAMANKILDNMPSFISGRDDPQVTLSIGISQYPENGLNAATLIKNADEAMYLAKKLGKNNYQLCEMKTTN